MAIKIKGDTIINNEKEWDDNHFIPSGDAAKNLGSVSQRWKDIHLGGDAHIGDDGYLGGNLHVGDANNECSDVALGNICAGRTVTALLQLNAPKVNGDWIMHIDGDLNMSAGYLNGDPAQIHSALRIPEIEAYAGPNGANFPAQSYVLPKLPKFKISYTNAITVTDGYGWSTLNGSNNSNVNLHDFSVGVIADDYNRITVRETGWYQINAQICLKNTYGNNNHSKFSLMVAAMTPTSPYGPTDVLWSEDSQTAGTGSSKYKVSVNGLLYIEKDDYMQMKVKIDDSYWLADGDEVEDLGSGYTHQVEKCFISGFYVGPGNDTDAP